MVDRGSCLPRPGMEAAMAFWPLNNCFSWEVRSPGPSCLSSFLLVPCENRTLIFPQVFLDVRERRSFMSSALELGPPSCFLSFLNTFQLGFISFWILSWNIFCQGQQWPPFCKTQWSILSPHIILFVWQYDTVDHIALQILRLAPGTWLSVDSPHLHDYFLCVHISPNPPCF